ncbi:hypothetical protein QBC35DRAFT_221101 [Podospora australis]|uniref:Zn(2)-C6 fungal-type domain-containing protein n=1 Tax=Podospora australis TaxID=1536484 RepID=A0AAN7AID0_9PEZI|nr:hypothetical protein QBC35DRAFT_221101 [Podospora australis]
MDPPPPPLSILTSCLIVSSLHNCLTFTMHLTAPYPPLSYSHFNSQPIHGVNTMNRLSSSSVAGNKGCRSCRSRRRGCGRALPSCPSCRRQSQQDPVLAWHRGNDGRMVSRGGHQRGIVSIRSRKLDLVKRHGETSTRNGLLRRKHNIILSLPRGLSSLARLARGDKSSFRHLHHQRELFFSQFASVSFVPMYLVPFNSPENGDFPLVTIPGSASDDMEMTDLYDLLVRMSLCEEMETSSDSIEYIDMEDEDMTLVEEFIEVQVPEAKEHREPEPEKRAREDTPEPEQQPAREDTPEPEEPKAESAPEAEESTAAAAPEPEETEEPTESTEPTAADSTEAHTEAAPAKPSPSPLMNILSPLHHPTPLRENDLAKILNSLLSPTIFTSITSSSSSSSEREESPFPSVDHVLQIMEVVSHLAETVLRPTRGPDGIKIEDEDDDRTSRIDRMTPEQLRVITNLRSLLDYATKVLCLRSIETSSSAIPEMANQEVTV